MASTKVLDEQNAMGEEFIQIEDAPVGLAAAQDTSKYDDGGLSDRPNFRSLEGMAKKKQENV
ncbi:hypothetical protein LPJ81_006630, partial [Coemansia sp. IMI 209127]